MTDPFTSEVSTRICKHMNEDHADAVLLYAKVFGDSVEATSAEMLKIDARGMDLLVNNVNNATNQIEAVPVRISFDHELQDAEDAHHMLIEMVKQARQQANRS